jgi:hypothetical protein
MSTTSTNTKSSITTETATGDDQHTVPEGETNITRGTAVVGAVLSTPTPHTTNDDGARGLIRATTADNVFVSSSNTTEQLHGAGQPMPPMPMATSTSLPSVLPSSGGGGRSVCSYDEFVDEMRE